MNKNKRRRFISSQEMKEKLINRVRKEPILWDQSLKRYQRSAESKDKIWQKISKSGEFADITGTPATATDLQLLWKGLIDNMRKEMKQKYNPNSGSEAPEYLGRWTHWEDMQFMIPILTPGKTEANLASPDHVISEPDINVVNVDDFGNMSVTKMVTEEYVDESEGSANNPIQKRKYSLVSDEIQGAEKKKKKRTEMVLQLEKNKQELCKQNLVEIIEDRLERAKERYDFIKEREEFNHPTMVLLRGLFPVVDSVKNKAKLMAEIWNCVACFKDDED